MLFKHICIYIYIYIFQQKKCYQRQLFKFQLSPVLASKKDSQGVV